MIFITSKLKFSKLP